jgi:DNA-binding NarL/FixJ family response regulator
LVAGRWSLVDAFTATGTRYVVAYENPSESRPFRALTSRERIILHHILHGRSGKWIALETGLSEPTVSRTVRAALRRLGVKDIAAIAGFQNAAFEVLENMPARIAVAVARHALETQLLSGLSSAERGVVAGMLNGKSIAAIANGRGTSACTVAHQATSIYRKLGVSSRGELLALVR